MYLLRNDHFQHTNYLQSDGLGSAGTRVSSFPKVNASQRRCATSYLRPAAAALKLPPARSWVYSIEPPEDCPSEVY
jgi:hypothetical protein